MAEHITTEHPPKAADTQHSAPGTEHSHHEDHNSPEYVAREKRKYLMVFGMLAILTIVTVGVSRLDVSPAMAIAIALIIASIKGSLVAAYFMHLISERRLVYAVLGLTAFFFGMLIWGPWHHHYDSMGHDIGQPGVEDTTHTTEKTH